MEQHKQTGDPAKHVSYFNPQKGLANPTKVHVGFYTMQQAIDDLNNNPKSKMLYKHVFSGIKVHINTSNHHICITNCPAIFDHIKEKLEYIVHWPDKPERFEWHETKKRSSEDNPVRIQMNFNGQMVAETDIEVR